MSDEVIYSEAQAEIYCALAMRTGQCAELLNNLSAGGAVTLDMASMPPRLAFTDAEQVKWLASGGREGRP